MCIVNTFGASRLLSQGLRAREWGVLAPVIFTGLQALQIITPVSCRESLAAPSLAKELLHSTIGLTVGSVAALASVGGAAPVRFRSS